MRQERGALLAGIMHAMPVACLRGTQLAILTLHLLQNKQNLAPLTLVLNCNTLFMRRSFPPQHRLAALDPSLPHPFSPDLGDGFDVRRDKKELENKV